MTYWDAGRFDSLARIVFATDYPGYRPHVVEAPAQDGAVDRGKRYAHICEKYLKDSAALDQQDLATPDPWNLMTLRKALYRAVDQAIQVAHALGVPHAWWPNARYSCIRLLEYPAGCGSVAHYDFNLLTLLLWRSHEHALQRDGDPARQGPQHEAFERRAETCWPGIHFGKLMPQVMPSTRATLHSVQPIDAPQRSMVFFAVPDHNLMLPDGSLVGDWINREVAAARHYEVP